MPDLPTKAQVDALYDTMLDKEAGVDRIMWLRRAYRALGLNDDGTAKHTPKVERVVKYRLHGEHFTNSFNEDFRKDVLSRGLYVPDGVGEETEVYSEWEMGKRFRKVALPDSYGDGQRVRVIPVEEGAP